MSEQEQKLSPALFAPFQPSPPVAPETPAAETEKQKKARLKREAKVAANSEPKAEKLYGKTSLKPHSPKFDLQTTLAAAKMLNEDDFALFEKLVIMFDEAGKPQRDRVLAAIGKVFG